MDVKDFWTQLEFRVCREIDGLPGDDFRGLWCDGFIPDRCEICDGRMVVSGRVWMAWGSVQHQWVFMLPLPVGATCESDVNWEAILPPEDVTGWLSLDRTRRKMKVDPDAAFPDRSVAR